MERATQIDERGYYLTGDGIYSDWGVPEKFRGDDIDRLAAYEDTGLEPEEILSAVDMAKVACSLEALNAYKELGSLDRLRELAEADREGRCVVLDVKIGQKVWILDAGEYGDDDEAYPLELNINGITLSDEHEIYYFIESPLGMDIDPFSHKDIGKTVFLTREEAEAALAKLNSET